MIVTIPSLSFFHFSVISVPSVAKRSNSFLHVLGDNF